MSARRVTVVDTEDAVIKELCSRIQKIASETLAHKNIFTVGLSGGSLVKFLAQGLPSVDTDWKKWKFFFCDERVVPYDDAESTYGAYLKAFIGKIPISPDQFVAIDPALSAEEAAKDYVSKIQSEFGGDKMLPSFDLLLLGMGPDGHTCSLFPGHSLLEENEAWVAPITDSPKPPPSRVTLTFPVINNAKNCIFAIAGAGKASMFQRVLKNEDLPVCRVKPTHGVLEWIVDKAANGQ